MPLSKNSAEPFHLLMENVREYAVFVMDPERRITAWNVGAERILGYSEDEALEMSADVIFTTEDRAAGAPEAEAARALATGEARDERWHVRSDGSLFWASGVMTALHGEAGEVQGFVKILRDNTTEKRAEEALRESAEALRKSEGRYRVLFDSMDQGYCVLDVILGEDGRPIDYRFVETNRAFQAQTGLVGAVGRTARDLVPDLEAHWVETYGRVATTGEPTRFEQGSEAMGRWFDVYASRIGGPGSRLVALLFTDITQRKGAEEARRESEARYRALFKQAPAFIAVLRGRDHRFEFVNPAYLRLVGNRDLLGRPVREALPDLEGQGLFEMLDRVYEGGEPFAAVDRPVVLHRNGREAAEERFVDFVYQPLREPDGAVSGVIALGVDTTDRVRAREALDRANGELERANRELERRVEARTRQVRRLASKLSVAEQEERRRIAHLLHDDLQQQLFGVSLTLSLVPRAESAGERDRLLDRAGRTLEQAATLTRTLATELSPAVLETDRLGDVLQWLAERARDLYRLDVEVEGDADIGDPALRTLLYHLVREVLFNVAKHAGTGRARITLDAADGHVILRVEDEGAGFDPSVLDTVRAGGGAGGFGLASVRERLAVVGGRLEVDSAPGEGTRVTLTVPRRGPGEG